jgi:geranylgeranyl pyrophosphate synthase
MVAEGTAVVTALIETGKIEAVVGVSCLSSLERVFPYMEAGAVPGMAMPLLQDGCANTTVDLDWVWDALYLTSEDRTRRLSLETLRHQVEEWFKPAALDEILGPVRSQTEGIARAWLAKSGKRWRPFLTVCAFAAFQDDPRSEPPADFRKIALAVECFHKASLIHDDIEDSDALRYGEKTLHEEYGVPVALNAGDFLLGEGYRLIAECACPPAAKAQMLQVAAGGHLTLCTGQGEELCWMREPAPLSPAEVVEIFRRKTAPAFEVALRLGAIYAGAGENVCAVLSSFSEALGVAYQIRDDLDDFAGSGEATDLAALRPSWLLATAYAAARDGDRELLEKAWRRQLPAASGPEVHKVLAALNIPQAARSAMEQHKERAILSLQGLENANLKGLLRRVLNRIFNEVERMGKCCDAEAGNAASGPAVGGSAA